MKIRMRKQTIAQIDDLKEKLHAPSRSDVIRRAIELNIAIVEAIEQGDRVIIEGDWGKKQIIIPGLEK